MFEHFDTDLMKASFEWDEEKDRINFMKHIARVKKVSAVLCDIV